MEEGEMEVPYAFDDILITYQKKLLHYYGFII